MRSLSFNEVSLFSFFIFLLFSLSLSIISLFSFSFVADFPIQLRPSMARVVSDSPPLLHLLFPTLTSASHFALVIRHEKR
jgi:hypothetical protein